MIWGFTEFRTNKKWKYDFFNVNFTSSGVKACLYLIDFKFPAKQGGCHFSLISDVNPYMPIYNVKSLKIPKGNQNPYIEEEQTTKWSKEQE